MAINNPLGCVCSSCRKCTHPWFSFSGILDTKSGSAPAVPEAETNLVFDPGFWTMWTKEPFPGRKSLGMIQVLNSMRISPTSAGITGASPRQGWRMRGTSSKSQEMIQILHILKCFNWWSNCFMGKGIILVLSVLPFYFWSLKGRKGLTHPWLLWDEHSLSWKILWLLPLLESSRQFLEYWHFKIELNFNFYFFKAEHSKGIVIPQIKPIPSPPRKPPVPFFFILLAAFPGIISDHVDQGWDPTHSYFSCSPLQWIK